MDALYGEDLAYVQAAAFGELAKGAAPEIIGRLRSAAIPVRRVVDAGCGAGPLAAALVEAGFEVTGIDQSPELLAIARNAVPGARFLPGSIYEMPLPECEAIVALGEALTYHAEDADGEGLVESFFRKVSAALPKGGVLIFDVIELGNPPLNGRYWNSGADWAVLAETQEDQSSRTLVRRIETFRQTGRDYRRSREIHRVRLFETGTLLDPLARCGFQTETALSYGAQRLGPRRRAFFCTSSGRLSRSLLPARPASRPHAPACDG